MDQQSSNNNPWFPAEQPLVPAQPTVYVGTDKVSAEQAVRDYMANLTAKLAKAEHEADSYYLVLVESGQPPTCTEYASSEELRARLESIVGVEVQAFVFAGHRWHITTGKSKFLLPHKGEALPLFETPTMADIDLEGYMFQTGKRRDKPPTKGE